METVMSAPNTKPSLPASPRLACRLACSSALAIAVALAAGGAPAAHAQSFNATSSVVSGSASVSTIAGATDVTVDTGEVVIDWVPTDTTGTGTIDFQSAGTTTTFAPGVSFAQPSYTVLNRILPQDATGNPAARAVQFNGTVQSFDAVGALGGNIWFYSPTGIIIGPTATFNTGSLVLTTDDIDATGGLYGTGNTIRFRGAAGSADYVDINPGASINVGAGSSDYLAIVAPRVVQAGTINVNGQTALVAAEQADITINAGLLDIVVSQGTTDSNGIVHTGTTSGAASTGFADKRLLQMVAMPKNTALTMLLSGNIGYTPAAVASNDGSSIVLSAGFASYVPLATQNLGLGNIQIGNSVFANALTANATNTIDILPAGGNVPTGGLVDFKADAIITGGFAINATANAGEEIRGEGNSLSLNATNGYQGGTTTVAANGGLIDATNFLTVSANAYPYSLNTPTDGAATAGGTVTLIADGGTITAQFLSVDSSAYGEYGLLTGGNATGGSSLIAVRNAGTISSNNLYAYSDASGAYGDNQAGNATGGSISLLDQGGKLALGNVYLDASGSGGDSTFGGGGNATGGAVAIDVSSGAQSWSSLSATANGYADLSAIAGNAAARPDGISLHVGGTGSLTVSGPISLTADGVTGTDGPVGYTATGGGVNVLVDNGGVLTADFGFNVYARAILNLSESSTFTFTTSPIAQGGNVSILADGGTILLASLDVSSSANGSGASIFAGPVTGGTSTVGAINSGLIRATPAGPLSGVTIGATAQGAPGPIPANATGGTATLYTSDGTLDLQGPTLVTADALDSDFALLQNGLGFDATGGTASVELRAGTLGTGSMIFTDLTVSSDGLAQGPGAGTTPLAGDGGTGTGGSATISIAAGTFSDPAPLVHANGYGGIAGGSTGPTAFTSGNGFGGNATFDISGGTASPTSVTVYAQGVGGGSNLTAGTLELASAGGDGIGGTATISASGDMLAAGSLSADAQGFGGQGMGADPNSSNSGGNGGNGFGGTAQLTTSTGGNAQLSAGPVTLTASGVGGDSGTGTLSNGNGGDGVGGTAFANLLSGTFTFGDTQLIAEGYGGNGQTGGSADGGTANFTLNDPATGSLAPRTLASLTLLGNATPAIGGTGTAGAAFFNVQAGGAGSALTIIGDFAAQTLADIGPAGNGFSSSIGGAAATVGGNTTISTVRDVSLATDASGVFDTSGTLTITTPRTVSGIGSIRSGGNAQISADLGIDIGSLSSGGTTLLQAVNGPVVVADLLSAGLVTVTGLSIDIASSGSLLFGTADATAGDLSIQTAGDLGAASVDAAGTVTLASTGGNVHTTGAVNGNGIAIASGGNTLADADLVSGGALNVSAGGTFTSAANVTAAGDLSISAAQGIAAPTLVSGGTSLLQAANGPISVASLTSPGLVTATGQSIDIASAGSLSFADAETTAGDLSIVTGGNLALARGIATGVLSLVSTGGSIITDMEVAGGAITYNASQDIQISGDVTSAGALALQAGGTIGIDAIATGTSINAASSDLVIGSGGQIGTRGTTQTILLTNNAPANTTYIGGPDFTGGYSLSDNEASALFADQSITIAVPTTGLPTGGPADFFVGNLNLSFGSTANIGTGGRLKIMTPGQVVVNGVVNLTTSSADDLFAIDPTQINIVGDTGSIVMRDASGALSGTLRLVADTIVAGTSSAISAVDAGGPVSDLSMILGAPSSVPSDAGYIQAGNIQADVTRGVFIQNTGTSTAYPARRGFSANRLSITTSSATSQIAINGMILGAAGRQVTGLYTGLLITINGVPAVTTGKFDPLSTINGCVIGSQCTKTVDPPTRIDLQGNLNPNGVANLNPAGRVNHAFQPIEINDQSEDKLRPLVDEPVTGVGNDDLWQPNCRPNFSPCSTGVPGH